MLSAAYITAAAVDDGHLLQGHHKTGQLEEVLNGDGLTGPLALLTAHALLHAPEGARCHTELLDPFLPDALRTSALVEALPNLEHTSVSTLAWRSANRFANPKQQHINAPDTLVSSGQPRRPTPSSQPATTSTTSRLLGTVAWKQAVDAAPTTGDVGGAQRYSLEYLDDTCNRMCTRRDGSASAVWVMPSLRSLTRAAVSSSTDSAIPLWLGMCCMTMVARSFQAGEAGRMKTLSEVDVLNGPAKAELSQLLQSMRQSVPAPLQSYFGDDILSAVFGVGGMLPEHLHLRSTLDAHIQEAANANPSYRSWVVGTLLSMALGSGLPTNTISHLIVLASSSNAPFIDTLAHIVTTPSGKFEVSPTVDIARLLGTELGHLSRHPSYMTEGLLPVLLERSMVHLSAIRPSNPTTTTAADTDFIAAFDKVGGHHEHLWGLPDDLVLRIVRAAPHVGQFGTSLARHAVSTMRWVSGSTFRLTGERKRRSPGVQPTMGPLPAHRMAFYLPPAYCNGELFSTAADSLVATLLLDSLVTTQTTNTPSKSDLGRFLSMVSADGLAAGCVPSGVLLDAVMAVRTPHSTPEVVDASLTRRAHAHTVVASLESCCVALCVEKALLTKHGIANTASMEVNKTVLTSAVDLLVTLIGKWGVRISATPARGAPKRAKSPSHTRPATRSHKQELIGTEFPSLTLAKLTALLIASPDLHTRLCGVRLGNSLLSQDRVVATQWHGRTVEQMYQLTKLFAADTVAGPSSEERVLWASGLGAWKELYKATMRVGGVAPLTENPIKERLVTASLQYMASRQKGAQVNPTHQALAAVAQELFPSSYRRAAGLIASGRGYTSGGNDMAVGSTDAVVVATENVLVPYTPEAVPHIHHGAMEQAMIIGPTSLDAPPYIVQQERDARREFWGRIGMGGIGGGGLYVSH